jgi:hypothetical protein
MNWGKSIVVAYVAFASFIGVLVTICMRHDPGLVAQDYYKQELVYQQRIDQIKNAADLSLKPTITAANNQVQISFADFSRVTNGEFSLFRPSDARQDKTYTLPATKETVQVFDVSAQQRGMYKARLRWTMDGKEYFIEETIYI